MTQPLKVIVAHTAYQQRGGEDSVVESEVALLRQRGHEVIEYRRTNNDVATIPRLTLAKETIWSARTGADIRKLIAEHAPDIVHVHNFVPLMSPSLHRESAAAGVAVVQTLHNFRLICPEAMLLRNGRVCEDCVGKVPWRAALHSCYRGSALQSAVLASMVAAHRGTWRKKVSRYIALNEFCKRKFIEGGLPAERIAVKPNFVDVAEPGERTRSGFLFVGRLSAEKGISTLVEAVRLCPGAQTRVAGAGPQAALVEGAEGVQALGIRTAGQIADEMQGAMALIVPSIWYENFPRTLVEAYANGLPAIASRLGALAELVEDGVTGLLFEPGDAGDLAAKLRWALANRELMKAMGRHARERYDAQYTAEKNYQQLIGIYGDAMKQSARNPESDEGKVFE